MDEIERQDLELVRLARARGAWRLRLGDVLEALASSGQHRELGFSSAKAYCLERVSFGPRWAGDSRALARRLGELPALRAAVAAGLARSIHEASSETKEAQCCRAWHGLEAGEVVFDIRRAGRREYARVSVVDPPVAADDS